MGLDSVGDLVLHLILSKLGPTETAKVACVSRRFRDSASEEVVWANFCRQDLGLDSPRDPLGNCAPSYKVTYQLWREAFAMYPWPLVQRGKTCWDRLKNWLAANFPEAKATLRRGASELELQDLERSLRVNLPMSARILYRLCDGQEIDDHLLESLHGSSLGIIGGYTFYSHLVNVFLLPVRKVIIHTKFMRRYLRHSSRPKHIVVAVSSTYSEKYFFLDCSNGQLYVGTKNLVTDAEMIPCVPSHIRHPHPDAMLLWLEEHARRLEKGIIKVLGGGKFRSISLFPEEPPYCSVAVTNGVKVRGSALFIPELADPQDDSEKYLFAYSIRMSLSPQGCVLNGMTFNSCQLHRRHWIIGTNGVVVSDVSGEAVIGVYPLLHPGEKEFVYESCTPLSTSTGSIKGSFTFVPGRLVDQIGSSFEVEVAEFPLQVPDYVY